MTIADLVFAMLDFHGALLKTNVFRYLNVVELTTTAENVFRFALASLGALRPTSAPLFLPSVPIITTNAVNVFVPLQDFPGVPNLARVFRFLSAVKQMMTAEIA
jgi:hypothetical protein